VLHENAVVMTAQVVAVNADDDPALAGHATNQNSLISVHCPFSPGIRKEPKKEKPPKNQAAAVVACGDFVFPTTSNPLFLGSRHLKGWFLSNLQVAGWLFGNHRS